MATPDTDTLRAALVGCQHQFSEITGKMAAVKPALAKREVAKRAPDKRDGRKTVRATPATPAPVAETAGE